MEPKVIAERAAKLGFPAVALTDRNGLYAAMAFTEACIAKGVQPIVGAMLARRSTARDGEALSTGWSCYAKDEQGYSNLCHLVSSAHLDRPVELDPHVPFSALEAMSDGLIAMTAGSEGALARLLSEGQEGKAATYLDRLRACFPDRLYMEIIRRNDPVEEASEEALIELAYERNLPLVATNPAAYSDPSFHAAHDAMLCIAQSAYIESNDRQTSSPEAWLKDPRRWPSCSSTCPRPSPTRRSWLSVVPSALRSGGLSCRGCRITRTSNFRRDAHAGLDSRLTRPE